MPWLHIPDLRKRGRFRVTKTHEALSLGFRVTYPGPEKEGGLGV